MSHRKNPWADRLRPIERARGPLGSVERSGYVVAGSDFGSECSLTSRTCERGPCDPHSFDRSVAIGDRSERRERVERAHVVAEIFVQLECVVLGAQVDQLRAKESERCARLLVRHTKFDCIRHRVPSFEDVGDDRSHDRPPTRVRALFGRRLLVRRSGLRDRLLRDRLLRSGGRVRCGVLRPEVNDRVLGHLLVQNPRRTLRIDRSRVRLAKVRAYDLAANPERGRDLLGAIRLGGCRHRMSLPFVGCVRTQHAYVRSITSVSSLRAILVRHPRGMREAGVCEGRRGDTRDRSGTANVRGVPSLSAGSYACCAMSIANVRTYVKLTTSDRQCERSCAYVLAFANVATLADRSRNGQRAGHRRVPPCPPLREELTCGVATRRAKRAGPAKFSIPISTYVDACAA